MDEFFNALVSKETDIIPEEYDWFKPLLGDWDFDYSDGYDSGNIRRVKGEWLFRRVLNGAGIEDLFICPSRKESITNPQKDGEYGVALRMFNKTTKCYDMTYACEGFMRQICFKKEDGKLVGTVIDNPSEKWVFLDISPNEFHWQNISVNETGEWKVNSDVFANRR